MAAVARLSLISTSSQPLLHDLLPIPLVALAPLSAFLALPPFLLAFLAVLFCVSIALAPPSSLLGV